jgi:ABC-type polysaccharide/polyol phosphate export permease
MIKKLLEVVEYRSLFSNLVTSELKLRYRRSVLGFFWTMLNPLGMMTILTLVFSTVMKFDVKDYAVLLFAGLLPWQFFAQSVGLSLMSIVQKGSLLKKVYIPKLVIPLSAVTATLVNFLLALVPLVLLMFFMGHPLKPAIAFLPVAILFIALFTCGVAFIFSCLNVFFRDFTHMTEVLLQAWFYASPVMYTIKMVPEKYRPIFEWNPVLYLIECFRVPVFDGQLPSTHAIMVAASVSILTCFFGLAVFTRFERHFVLRV